MVAPYFIGYPVRSFVCVPGNGHARGIKGPRVTFDLTRINLTFRGIPVVVHGPMAPAGKATLAPCAPADDERRADAEKIQSLA